MSSANTQPESALHATLAQRGFGYEPWAPDPKLGLVMAKRLGDFVFLSGHPPVSGGRLVRSGRVGGNIGVADAAGEAGLAALALILSLRKEVGNINKVVGFADLVVYVNCGPDFNDHSTVAKGASDMILSIFGPVIGAHSRTAVGCSSLPLGFLVEVSAVAAVSQHDVVVPTRN